MLLALALVGCGEQPDPNAQLNAPTVKGKGQVAAGADRGMSAEEVAQMDEHRGPKAKR